jgi:hypothetical protein
VTRWVPRIASTFGLWLVVAVAAWVLGNEPRPGLLALMIAVGAALLWLFLDVSADTEATRWPRLVDEQGRPPGEDPGLERLQRLLTQHQSAHEVGDALHRRLAQLTEQRLVARHGVSLVADPERAAGLLGAELTAVVRQQPPYPRLSRHQIDVLLQRIEDL